MYSPYSSHTKRNKSRLYLFIGLAVLLYFIYWKYSSASKNSLTKGKFQSAGENLDSIIDQSKQKIDTGIDNVKDKIVNVVDAAKHKSKKAADTIRQKANDAKQ